jgi:hypothetical protein
MASVVTDADGDRGRCRAVGLQRSTCETWRLCISQVAITLLRATLTIVSAIAIGFGFNGCAFSVVMGTSPPPGREEGWGFFFPHAGELVALTGRRPVLPCVRSASFTHSQSAVLGPIETVGDTAHTRARVEHEPDSLRLTSLPAG